MKRTAFSTLSGTVGRRGLLLSPLALLGTPGLAQQAFPSRPIRIVVPFPAGGGTDLIARVLGEGMARELGQPVLVENRAGGGTVIGNDAVAKSAPDGHTLLLSTSSFAIVPALATRLPYAQETGFSSVMLLGRAPNVAVVRTDSPIVSARDFLARARARPGALTYASSGNGTSTHLAAELLKSMSRTFVTHVPYRGSGPLVTDLIGGQIDVGFVTLPSVAPFVASGKLRALAVTGALRSPLLPDVPTFAESGVPGYQADVWYGVFAAGGTPAAVVDRLNEVMKKVAQTEDFKRRTAGEGLQLALDTPADTRVFVRSEEAKWRKVVVDQSVRSD